MTVKMIAIALQSGSNGNCIYVEAGGKRLLFDAGISALQAERRLEALGRDIRKVDAVIVSHDHRDHVQCAGVYHRKFKLPIFLSPPTFERAQDRVGLGKLSEVNHFESGQQLQFGSLTVHTICTPHDAADGVAFVIDDGRRRLGVLTDLGHVFAELQQAIGTLDAVFLESNYDPKMLSEGPYPWFLQQRIRGDHGHISNLEAADLLRSFASSRLQWACLSHLSEHNNHPDLALQAHRDVLGNSLPIHVASRHQATGVFEVV